MLGKKTDLKGHSTKKRLALKTQVVSCGNLEHFELEVLGDSGAGGFEPCCHPQLCGLHHTTQELERQRLGLTTLYPESNPHSPPLPPRSSLTSVLEELAPHPR